MPTINLDGIQVQYEIRKSKQANTPRIDSKLGNIKVVIPHDQDHSPEKLLKDKKRWVLKRQQEFFRFKNKIPERSFNIGESFPHLGKKKPLQEGKKNNITDDKILLSTTKIDNKGIKPTLEEAYRENAREHIHRLIERYEDEVENDYKKIYIRDQRTKWGSCSTKQNLNFNWRLIMAPQHVLKYVVIHELTHLDIKKHNEAFWTKIRNIYPNYHKSQKWLENNSAKLVFDRAELENS